MKRITINEGPLTADDNAVYYTPEVEWVAERVPIEGSMGRDYVIMRWAVFTPRNGSRPNQEMRVPGERVVSIQDDDSQRWAA